MVLFRKSHMVNPALAWDSSPPDQRYGQRSREDPKEMIAKSRHESRSTGFAGLSAAAGAAVFLFSSEMNLLP
jgi:hypothetical protein